MKLKSLAIAIFLTCIGIFAPLESQAILKGVAGGGSSGGPTTNPVSIAQGGTGASTTQDALNNLNNTPIGSLAYVPVQCTGSGDEQAFLTAAPLAQNAKTSMLVGNGCQPANQWILNGNTYTSLFGWGSSPTDANTAGNIIPRISVFSAGIAANAPGQAFLDLHGPRSFSMENVNLFGSDVTQPATLIENSSQNGNCCASNAVHLTGVSLTQTQSAIGCPMDGNLNCVQAGGVFTGALTTGGSGYVDGTYYKVALTGGSGTTAFADKIVVSGGIVTAVNLTDGAANSFWGYPGKNYVVGDTLSASNANLGGSGSGFVFTVVTIMKATPTSPNILVRLQDSQVANIGGCGVCANTSDFLADRDEWTGIAGVAFQPIFGGGGNELTNQRIEFSNSGFLFGGPNTAGADNGASIVGNSLFTHTQSYDTQSRTTSHFDLTFGGGDGYIADGDMFNLEQTTDTPIVLGGGPVALKNVVVGNSVLSGGNGGSHSTHMVEIKNSSGGVTPDYIYLNGIIANGGAIVSPVLYTNTPAHFVEDSIGPGGQHAEKGRPFGIGTSTPSSAVALDLSGNTTKPLYLPLGTTGARPTAAEGYIWYNTTTHNFEGASGASPTWAALGGGGTGLVEVVGITVDGGGSAITTGSKGYLQIPYNATISQWSVFGDQSGSAVIDIKRSTYAGFPPTASLVGGGNSPTLSSQTNNTAAPSGWTSTTVNAGDVLLFSVSSASTVQRVNLNLQLTRQ